MNMPDLHGKTALVTGGGRGIGRSTCLALARCGARGVITARDVERIAGVANEIERGGGEAIAVAGDISQEDSVVRMVEAAGHVDILVNNAGTIHPIAPVLSTEFSAWKRNLEVNLDGVFLTCHYALPGMIERGWGRIVNVTAGSVKGNQAAWGAYSAAKGGVEVLTKVLAHEVGDHGIRVNAIRPGIVDTDMQQEIRDTSEDTFGRDNRERFRGYKQRGLLRSPDDPAKLVLWLLTPDADETNGEVLIIDDPDVAARIGVIPRGR
ncbi:MAG: SDR family NAD(P)-dependent oxidoreductase [Chloroflexota bacterium]